ncbi:MAG TPA: DUF4442 domain-containing protein [Flavisolibacter sp.]|jgi:hypothetical protein|nr:DUF4442 domain-containing protein [Flavisolibacter sp.]
MTQETVSLASSAKTAFYALINNPFKFRLFLLQKLPAAYFSGLKIKELNDHLCAVTVPYKWFTKNPFRSTYFACLSMAAEMSTGVLAMANTYQRKPAVSMLVTGLEANFYKKAVAETRFICEGGIEIEEAIAKAIALDLPQVVKLRSSGYNAANELVAEFYITWSFKAK